MPGRNLIAEVDAYPATPVVARAYAWAPSTGAGQRGVGHLLMASLGDGAGNTKTVYYGYDGNGNVNCLSDTSGDIVGSYDYDPFGQLTAVSGDWAAFNPIRFSTKYRETTGSYGDGKSLGLYYYGARYYCPLTGRFINRDPMEESGGVNLYGFCHNDGVNLVDPTGRCYGDVMPDILMENLPSANDQVPGFDLAQTVRDVQALNEQGYLSGRDGAPLTSNNGDNQDSIPYSVTGSSLTNDNGMPISVTLDPLANLGYTTGGGGGPAIPFSPLPTTGFSGTMGGTVNPDVPGGQYIAVGLVGVTAVGTAFIAPEAIPTITVVFGDATTAVLASPVGQRIIYTGLTMAAGTAGIIAVEGNPLQEDTEQMAEVFFGERSQAATNVQFFGQLGQALKSVSDGLGEYLGQPSTPPQNIIVVPSFSLTGTLTNQ